MRKANEKAELRQLTESELTSVSGGDGGQNVAAQNQLAGPFGASGNPNSAAGPGYFYMDGQQASEAIHIVQAGGSPPPPQ